MNTALREAEEEIGLAPDDVNVLGELDDTTNFNLKLCDFAIRRADSIPLRFQTG